MNLGDAAFLGYYDDLEAACEEFASCGAPLKQILVHEGDQVRWLNEEEQPRHGPRPV